LHLSLFEQPAKSRFNGLEKQLKEPLRARFDPRRTSVIVDCHTHIFPEVIRTRREVFCAEDAGFAAIYRDPKARMVGAEELIASMDRAGVDRAVICGFAWGEPHRCALHNQYLLESASQSGGRLIPFISLVMTDCDSVRALEEGIRLGAKGVGEIAFYAREISTEDIPRMTPVLSRMEEMGIPLLLHTNENIGHSYPGKGSTRLERFYELVLAFGRLRVVLAHWGGGLLFYELMPEVARAMKNVYYDTAASPYLYAARIYPVACQIVGPEKILFGSDFPLISPARYIKELGRSGLSDEDQAKILGLNVLKLLAGS
jgi:uncharacterized protein